MKPTDEGLAMPPQTASGHDGGHGHHRHRPDELHNEGVAHEHSDINVRAIVGFLAALAAVTAIASLAMWGLFRVFEGMAAANDPPVSPLAASEPQMPARTTGSPYFGGAPQPQLLTNEPRLLQELRQNEDGQLHRYGWVDEKAGVARVPISEAKKLLIERGLPVRSGAPVDPGLGSLKSAGGEASGGRALGAGGRAPETAPGKPPKTDTPAPQTGKH